jgi:hypothetical protein
MYTYGQPSSNVIDNFLDWGLKGFDTAEIIFRTPRTTLTSTHATAHIVGSCVTRLATY